MNEKTEPRDEREARELHHARRRSLIAGASAPDSVRMKSLSVIVLSSSESGRRTLVAAFAGSHARVVRETSLPERDALPRLLASPCNILIVDLNQDSERALELVEAACGLDNEITVMVYSRRPDQELLVRSMRAGAREFLSDPLLPNMVAEALVRASVRREEVHTQRKALGKLLVFVGAKGGSGVTTVAANFAIALAKESGESVVLVDLNLQLGDAALTLGLSSEFSTLDALQNERRLDSELVSRLLASHSSGLKVLAAPDYLMTEEDSRFLQPEPAAVMKMMNILRGDFSWVVVDAGCHYGGYTAGLFDAAEKVYLVTQVSVAELRNCHRVVTSTFSVESSGKLEVVLNRLATGPKEIDEKSISNALKMESLAGVWKVPSDYHTLRKAQNTATAVAMKDSAIARVLTSMARAACGKAGDEGRKRRFGLFS
jgi:pilus assembly protein CpaE